MTCVDFEMTGLTDTSGKVDSQCDVNREITVYLRRTAGPCVVIEHCEFVIIYNRLVLTEIAVDIVDTRYVVA